MIFQLKRFTKSIMIRGDAYLDDENCVLLGKMFFGQIFAKILLVLASRNFLMH